MNKYKKQFISVVVSFTFYVMPLQVNSTGILVLDVANLTQAMQQVAAWQQQYSQMLSIINTGKSTLNAMTGDRGMGGLLSGNRTYLPPDWNSAMTVLNQGGGTSYGALASAALHIRSAQQVLSSQQTSKMSPQMQQYIEQARNLSASQQAIGQEAYKTAAMRVNLLQTLTNAINGQTDPKAIMDLQARIQSEQAALANDQAQLQSVAQLTVAQAQAQKVIANEIRAQTSGAGNFPTIDTSLP